MQKIIYYEVRTIADPEGISTRVIGRYSTYSEAFKRADGNGGYGSTIDPRKVEITIYDTVEEAEQEALKSKIEQQKLTEEEIRYIKENL
jgi:hypothetical protein